MCRPALTRLLLLHLLLIKLHNAKGGLGGLAQSSRASERHAFAGAGLVPLLGTRVAGVTRPHAGGNPIVCRGVCVCVCKQARQGYCVAWYLAETRVCR